MVMNHSKCWVASLLAVSALTAAFSQQTGATNGAIIDQKPCVFGPYEQQSEFTRRYYSKEDYDYAKSSPRTECSRIEYRSDGLRVVGYLVRSRDIASRRFPVIIFNRGGFLVLALRTDDPNPFLVGYCPRYLLRDTLDLLRKDPKSLDVAVERINLPPAPLQLRLLCNMSAHWPEGFVPFSGD